jgi:predicted dehydrogenase
VTTRALVVGLGAIGQRHARNLRALLGDDLVLSALRSRRHNTVIADGLVTGQGTPEDDCNGGVFTDLDAALSQRPDLVFICTPSNMHVETAIAAVEAGAAVFIEKPLSSDLDGVDELAARAKSHQAVVAVGCQLRFHPALQRLRALVDDEAVGRMLAVHIEQAEYLPSFHPYEDYRTSYAARRELGGGVIVTQIHEIDYLQWIFGMPDRLFAVGGRLGDLEVDVEDTASALLEVPFHGSPLAVHLHLDYLQRPPRRTCRVVGTTGVIDVDLRAPRLQWTDNDGTLVESDDFPGHDRTQMFVAETESFLEAYRGEHPPEVGLEYAIATLKIAAAIRMSLEDQSFQVLS